MPEKTIREIIRITGTTEKALRYYDEKGIVSPTSKGKSGRREWLYDEEAVRKIKWVVLFRRLEMGIEDIGRILGTPGKTTGPAGLRTTGPAGLPNTGPAGLPNTGPAGSTGGSTRLEVIRMQLEGLRARREELDRKIALAELLLMVDGLPEGNEKEKVFAEILDMEEV